MTKLPLQITDKCLSQFKKIKSNSLVLKLYKSAISLFKEFESHSFQWQVAKTQKPENGSRHAHMFSKGCAASNLKGTASIDCTDKRVTAKICARCARVFWVWLAWLTHTDCYCWTEHLSLNASVQLLAMEQNLQHPKYLRNKVSRCQWTFWGNIAEF